MFNKLFKIILLLLIPSVCFAGDGTIGKTSKAVANISLTIPVINKAGVNRDNINISSNLSESFQVVKRVSPNDYKLIKYCKSDCTLAKELKNKSDREILIIEPR